MSLDTSTAMNATFYVKHVKAQWASELLLANPDMVVLDLRTTKEISSGYIEGATFADFKDDTFKSQLSQLDRNKQYIIHCKAGGRSEKALPVLKELGFKHITHLDGGLDGWKKENLPLVKPK